MKASLPLAVVVAEDEPAQRKLLADHLRGRGHEVSEASSGEEVLERVQAGHVDLLLLDFRMPGGDGLEAFRRAREVDPEVDGIILTAYGTVETAVAAMKEGMYDYLAKPIDLGELDCLIGRVAERRALVAEVAELREKLTEKFDFANIVGGSGPMAEALSTVARAARSDATILILGESGTGKELFANAIHLHSRRARGPLVKVSCAALPETLLESELFGYERGAFTGATARRVGRFESAHGGTLFLDEVGEIPPSIQVKLLRVLQERAFERLGGNETVRADVRLIAATNKDLEGEVRAGRFREDLYYRLNVIPLRLSPLRERRGDLPLLIDHFVQKCSRAEGKTVRGLTREARDLLLRYHYPGNVRELENAIARAVVLARGEVIRAEDLPLAIREVREEGASGEGEERPLSEVLSRVEREMIERALEEAGGVQVRAAERLGISERMLRYKLAKYRGGK